MPLEEELTAPRVAELFGVNVESVRRWNRRGKLPAIDGSQPLRWAPETVLNALRDGLVQPVTPIELKEEWLVTCQECGWHSSRSIQKGCTCEDPWVVVCTVKVPGPDCQRRKRLHKPCPKCGATWFEFVFVPPEKSRLVRERRNRRERQKRSS
jgi:predicted nucleic-acid-binding Zn-ribbon protein